MARLANIFLLLSFMLYASILAVLATPVPIDGDIVGLEKRRTGRGTYFYPGLGNCGKQDNSNSWIVAISRSIYAKGKYCERSVRLKYRSKGVTKTATAKVRDSCGSCGPNDIDMSPPVFRALAGSLDPGVIYPDIDISGYIRFGFSYDFSYDSLQA